MGSTTSAVRYRVPGEGSGSGDRDMEIIGEETGIARLSALTSAVTEWVAEAVKSTIS